MHESDEELIHYCHTDDSNSTTLPPVDVPLELVSLRACSTTSSHLAGPPLTKQHQRWRRRHLLNRSSPSMTDMLIYPPIAPLDEPILVIAPEPTTCDSDLRVQ